MGLFLSRLHLRCRCCWMKIARDSTKGEIVNVDYAREYGIDVEVLRLEHPAQPGQMRAKREHQARSKVFADYSEALVRAKDCDSVAKFSRSSVVAFNLDQAERVLLAQVIPLLPPTDGELRRAKKVAAAREVLMSNLAYKRRNLAQEL